MHLYIDEGLKDISFHKWILLVAFRHHLLYLDVLQVLISRNYRGDIDMGVIEKFMPLVMEREDDGNMAPIVQVSLVWFWLDRLTKDEILECN